jgi:hypothetical protein
MKHKDYRTLKEMYDSLEERVLSLEDRFLRINLPSNSAKDYEAMISSLDKKFTNLVQDLSAYSEEKEKLMNIKIDRALGEIGNESKEMGMNVQTWEVQQVENRILDETMARQREIEDLNDKIRNSEEQSTSVTQQLVTRMESIEKTLKELTLKQEAPLNIEISNSLQRLSALSKFELEKSEPEGDPVSRSSSLSKPSNKKKQSKKKGKSAVLPKRRVSLNRHS